MADRRRALGRLDLFRIPVGIDLAHQVSDVDHLVVLLGDLSAELRKRTEYAFSFADLPLNLEDLAAEASVSLGRGWARFVTDMPASITKRPDSNQIARGALAT